MKKLLLLFLIGTPLVAAAQQSNAQQEVASVMEKLMQAMENPNESNLKQLTHQNLSYGHSSARIENRDQFMQSLLSGQSDFVKITPEQETISVVGSTAIVRHILQATTLDEGKPGSIHLPVLYVWTKEQNTWKLLARQAVKRINQ